MTVVEHVEPRFGGGINPRRRLIGEIYASRQHLERRLTFAACHDVCAADDIEGHDVPSFRRGTVRMLAGRAIVDSRDAAPSALPDYMATSSTKPRRRIAKRSDASSRSIRDKIIST